MTKKGTLPFLSNKLLEMSSKSDVSEDHLWYVIRGAIDPNLLISNLSEALRISAIETSQLLIENGFGDLVAHAHRGTQDKLTENTDTISSKLDAYYSISSEENSFSSVQDLFSIEFSPPLNQKIKLSSSQKNEFSLLIKSIIQSEKDDAFLALYRNDVIAYFNNFLATDAKLIDSYIEKEFKDDYPRYIVNSGMGANEQFNHFISYINNSNPNRLSTWLIIDSPRHLVRLPPDANIKNTLFLEFSRSGKTEETVKIHEYTPRDAKRIVFANSGPLRDIGRRDKNLVLDLPDQVSGRFGRNKTPILLAPMYIAKMDINQFWHRIENAISEFDLSSPSSLPLQMAQFIYLYQQINKINHIYLGCNDTVLTFSANELIQFWNEGVNKNNNDISMSTYFGLLRDSHANIEGLLANHKTKMAIFLFPDTMSYPHLHPMILKDIDPINKDHIGLCYGDEERILAEANYQRFSELMPTIKITVHGILNIDHAAFLGQLWSDTTFCYSKMMNVDPGSNPEVRHVRDRSSELLANFAKNQEESNGMVSI